jgi:hypothetical protein
MSDTNAGTSIPTPADIAPPAQAPATSWDDLFKGEDPKKVKEALDNSRKWESRAKENKAAADELAQIKPKAVEADTLRQQLEEAPKRVADDLRGTLAEVFDIAEGDASLYLTSDDPKTLLQQALGLVKRSANGSTTPKPDRSQGGSGTPLALNSDGLEEALRSKLGL